MTTLTAWLYGTPVATLAPTGLRTTDGKPLALSHLRAHETG